MAVNIPKVVLENVQILWPNFSGRVEQFNAAGNREFTLLLDPDIAEAMRRDGWNVREIKAREEGDIAREVVTVAVSFTHRPPKVWLVTSRGRNMLDESQVGMLDFVEPENIDLILSPYLWDVNGRTGVKAYLESIYVTIVEDPLEAKYADMDAARG